ncbi:hypothetical protein FBY41_0071 [Humibacillus xanthopallidus]|uniref:Uncharacterized protein n=1 Tax=Humibacillus xanthopallidus TaxID=412689 RepID=A0A543HZF2_9MICO|nr:hypothetical protein FBY41_0071 [Humibacillus xanthopallidus]
MAQPQPQPNLPIEMSPTAGLNVAEMAGLVAVSRMAVRRSGRGSRTSAAVKALGAAI